jgi:pyruvate kinase
MASAEVAVRTEVVCGGAIGDHKGINLPGVRVCIPSLTDKDLSDLHFALNQGVDMVALSFVRSAATSSTSATASAAARW